MRPASSTDRHRRGPHRGSGGSLQVFAPVFIAERMTGFEKDMRICLTPIPAVHRKGETHAYFPALAACCGAIEYLAAMVIGRPKAIRQGLARSDVSAFADAYMRQPDYSSEAIRILWDLFRNGTAHHGITSGVWIDKHAHEDGRRMTWSILASDQNPAIEVVAKEGVLRLDPPWDCAYTHIAKVRLGRLVRDVRSAADRVAEKIASGDDTALRHFKVAMEVLYPK
jgi:hypothetical protein